jgi:predicted unusual protein kinase regulating ubiquinone biosynthesis (AarF/ABC1/UbiB family)
VRQVVRDTFGERAEVLLAAMEPAPFSVASIAQVHRADLPEHGAVAVKVRHPGIEAALKADFSMAGGGVALANTVLLGLASSAKAMIEESRATLLAECDFAREAEHQRLFRRWLEPHGAVVVPEVIDAWSGAAVLTTRWETGLSLDAFLASGPSQAARDRAGVALFEVMVGGFHRLGLLYADPHPGNFAFRDGQVVVYDFGCVRAFSAEQTAAFNGIASALRARDRAALFRAARTFGFGLDGQEREALFERFAKSFFAPLLHDRPSVIAPDGAVEAAQLVRDKRALAKLGLPPHLLFLLRLRFGLYAVLARLEARADWGALEAGWAAQGRWDA